MVGIVVVSHGLFSHEMINSLKMVTETAVTGIVAVGISPKDNISNLRKMIESAISEVDFGNGVLLMSDMFGGSASNLSLSFLNHEKVEVISGVNLPMLLKVFQEKGEKNVSELAKDATVFGKENIILASDV